MCNITLSRSSYTVIPAAGDVRSECRLKWEMMAEHRRVSRSRWRHVRHVTRWRSHTAQHVVFAAHWEVNQLKYFINFRLYTCCQTKLYRDTWHGAQLQLQRVWQFASCSLIGSVSGNSFRFVWHTVVVTVFNNIHLDCLLIARPGSAVKGRKRLPVTEVNVCPSFDKGQHDRLWIGKVHCQRQRSFYNAICIYAWISIMWLKFSTFARLTIFHCASKFA